MKWKGSKDGKGAHAEPQEHEGKGPEEGLDRAWENYEKAVEEAAGTAVMRDGCWGDSEYSAKDWAAWKSEGWKKEQGEEREWDDWNDPDQPQPGDHEAWKDYKKWEAEQDRPWHSQDYQNDRYSQDYQNDRYSQGSQQQWGHERQWENAPNPQSYRENEDWGSAWYEHPRYPQPAGSSSWGPAYSWSQERHMKPEMVGCEDW